MEKDGPMEDIIDEMTIMITPDSGDDSNDEHMIDENDRQIIDRAMQQSTPTETESNKNSLHKPKM